MPFNEIRAKHTRLGCCTVSLYKMDQLTGNRLKSEIETTLLSQLIFHTMKLKFKVAAVAIITDA